MCGLRYGLRRRACGLLACVPRLSFRSLAPARSLAAICPPCRRFALFYPGRCVAIYGLFLPLSCRRWRFSIHALKWHPVASHGHFRRCCPLLFLGSPRRLVLATLPLFPALSRRRCHGVGRVFSCGELVKTARVRSFVSGTVSPLLVSCGWCGVGVIVCRAGRAASAGRRAYLYRFARPLPLGAGEYVRPAGVGSACGEGVGGVVVVSLSRCLSSCRRVVSRRHRLPHAFLLALSSCSRRLVVPYLLACGLVPHPLRPFLPSLRARVIVLSPLSPFSRQGGRGVLCLLASFVAALVPSSRFPHSLRSSPCLLVPRWIALARPHLVRSLPLPLPLRLRSCLVVSPFAASPRSSTSVGGERVGSLLLAHRFALVLVCGFPRRAGGVRRRRGLCSVCGVVVCIYKLGACSCIMGVVEREQAIEKGFSTMNEMVLNGVSVAAGLVASPLMGIGLATGAVPVLTFGLYLATMGWNTYRAVKCYENR